MNALFVTKAASKQITAKASSYLNITIAPPVINGYTVIGFGSFYSGDSRLPVSRVGMNGNIEVRNVTSTEITATASIRFLYVKNFAYGGAVS